MNRRGFLKNIGIGTCAVIVAPSITLKAINAPSISLVSNDSFCNQTKIYWINTPKGLMWYSHELLEATKRFDSHYELMIFNGNRKTI